MLAAMNDESLRITLGAKSVNNNCYINCKLWRIRLKRAHTALRQKILSDVTYAIIILGASMETRLLGCNGQCEISYYAALLWVITLCCAAGPPPPASKPSAQSCGSGEQFFYEEKREESHTVHLKQSMQFYGDWGKAVAWRISCKWRHSP